MLNDEQRNFATENHNLIYSYLSANNLSIEEWYDLAAIGFCKAVLNYDESKGKFSTFAYRCMQNEIYIEKRKQWAIQRADENMVLYYDALISCDDEGNECSLLSLIPDYKQNVEKISEVNIGLFNVYSKLNDIGRKAFHMFLKGYTQKDISVVVGRSRQWVSRFQKKLRTLYDKL